MRRRNPDSPWPFRFRTARLAVAVPTVAAKALGKQGLAFAHLLERWPQIVGEDAAAGCLPVKLAFPPGSRTDGVLTIGASGARGVLLQHRAPLILERINVFFGWRAVERLKIVDRPPQSRPIRPAQAPGVAARPLAEAERRQLEAQAAAIEDPELRAALLAILEAASRRR